MRPWLSAAAATLGLVGLVGVALLGARTPALPAEPAAAEVTAFSPARAFAHLEAIAGAPRPPGSPAHDAARDHLVRALGEAGLQVQVQTRTWVSSRYTSFDAGYPVRAARVENVVGVLPGTSPNDRAVLLVAHYDSKTSTPGASDDGYGTAALLEVARALAAGPRLPRTVVVLFTDAEEEGLLGAEAYVRGGGPLFAQVGVVLNFEARGNAGPALLFETAGADYELVRRTAAVAPALRGNSLARAVYARMPNDTDFSVFRAARLPGLNFANIAGFSRYHAPADTVANASRATLAHHGTTGLAAARALAEAPPDAPLAPDRGPGVFFDVAGVFVVYPGSWSPFVTGAAFLALFAGVLLAAAADPRARRRLLLLVGVQLAALVAALVVSLGLLLLVNAVAPGAAGPDTRPVVVQLVGAGFVLLAFAAAALAAQAFRSEATVVERQLAGAALMLFVTLLLHQSLPGGAYLFAWPALFTALAAVAALRLPPRFGARARAALLAVALVPTVLLVAPHAYHVGVAFGVLAGPGLTLLAAVVLLGAPAAVLAATPPRPYALPAVAAGLALLAALAPLALSRHDAAHPRPGTLLLAVDADAMRAEWLSPDPAPPSWARERFAPGTTPEPRPAFFPLEPGRLFHAAPAPAAIPFAARVELLATEPVGEGRRLRLRVHTPPDTVVLALYTSGALLRRASLDGVPVDDFAGDRLALHLWGPADEGTELVLETRGPRPLELVAITQHMLPPPAGRPATHAAKPSMVLPPHQELMDSDTMLVRRAFGF